MILQSIIIEKQAENLEIFNNIAIQVSNIICNL